ncbi:glycosyltransferase family 2 protein [Virgibacillus sp. L01]|uniref:glycosyltransferase family 2 protein n=1 Tax=Virgibacillus sp. L01 TaxID=3457429 RepID=UPI003FD2D667
MKPTISIIVPVYNIELYIGKCLDSIIKQTFTDFEVIVVNDGSTDESGVICDEYAGRDKRIKVLHKGYGGVSSARNAGVETASGDYIGFVDGDDYIDVNMYKCLYTLCQKQNSDISICHLGREIKGKLVNRTNEEFTEEMDNVEAMKQLFKGVLYRFSLCNKLFKKNCFDQICFPEGRIHEDLSTTYKLFSKANTVFFINYTGYIYVKRNNSILSSDYYEKRLDAFVGWDEILPFMKKHYPQLSEETNACFTYVCVDHIYYILNQVEDKKEREKYLRSVRTYVRKYYKQIRGNGTVAVNCTLITTILYYNVKLLILANSVKNIRKGFIVRS